MYEIDVPDAPGDSTPVSPAELDAKWIDALTMVAPAQQARTLIDGLGNVDRSLADVLAPWWMSGVRRAE